MQPRVLSLIDHTHPAAAQLLGDAVVRNSLPISGAESYVRETGKSMKAKDLTVPQGGS